MLTGSLMRIRFADSFVCDSRSHQRGWIKCAFPHLLSSTWIAPVKNYPPETILGTYDFYTYFRRIYWRANKFRRSRGKSLRFRTKWVEVKHRCSLCTGYRIAGAIRRNVPPQFTRVLFLHSSNRLVDASSAEGPCARLSYSYLRWTRAGNVYHRASTLPRISRCTKFICFAKKQTITWIRMINDPVWFTRRCRFQN